MSSPFKINNKIYSLIPARGGSKSIPMKNLIPLMGRPLLSYSVTTSLNCPLIQRTFVSTDSPRIRSVALSLGAEAPFLRPRRISGDRATDIQAFLHWLQFLQKTEGEVPSIIVHLRPTSPLRTQKFVRDGIRLLQKNPRADSVRSVEVANKHPFKMWSLKDNGFLEPLIKGSTEKSNLPRQRLPTAYVQTGTLDVLRTSSLLKWNSMTGKKVLPILTPLGQSVDIDSYEDLHYADFLLQQIKAEKF